jgi:hypothetical protein
MDTMAAWIIAPLLITGVIAIVAFVTRRRAAFVFGALACWIVTASPGPPIHAQYHTQEAAYMAAFNDGVARSWERAPMAGLIGTIIGLLVSELSAAKSAKERDAPSNAPLPKQ